MSLALRLLEILNSLQAGDGWLLFALFFIINTAPSWIGDLHTYYRTCWIVVLVSGLIYIQEDIVLARKLIDLVTDGL